MHIFRLRVHRCHRFREFAVNSIINRDYSKIRIFPIEAARGGLIGMFEPVIADDGWALERSHDIFSESRRPLGLSCNQGPSTVGVG